MKIKSVKNLKFKDSFGIYTTSGLALYEDGKGFVTMDGETPYIPQGGRKALQSILDNGGFEGDVKYIRPVA